MIAAAYCRVSTEEQASEGFSLPAQINEIGQYCQKNNVQLYKVYKDEGVSGTKEMRPAFQEMIKDAEKGLFNIILVHRFDRFARRIELSHKIKSRLKKANVNVISITEPIEDSPIGFFQEGLLELLAEYFIRNLSKEIKKGKNERASQGLHNGNLSYGYKFKNGEVYLDETEAEIVRKIFHMYVHEGFGYTKIARLLNDSGAKTQYGHPWRHHQVHRALQNPIYAGWIYYDGNLYESKLPVIVDRELYNLAQELRQNNNGQSFGRRGDNYNKFLLHGLVRCGECGCLFKHIFAKGNKVCQCNWAQRRIHDGKCNFTKQFSSKKLEKRILSDIQHILEDTSIKLDIVKREPIEDIITASKQSLEQELARAKQAYLKGVFDLDEYEQIRKKLESDISDLKQTKKSDHPSREMRKKIKNAMQEFESYPQDDIVNRKLCLQKIIHQIYIHPEKIIIEFKG
jgi:site-specific DNA recombinase